jgi:hypothetical protein
MDFNPIGSIVSSEHKGVSRNYATSTSSGSVTANGVTTSGLNYGSPVFRDTSMGLAYLPTYRAGDLLTFAFLCKNAGSVVKVNEGDVLTFICSKQSATAYDNYTVQYVDQATLSPSDRTSWNYYTFKLRDDLEDGRYKLEVRLYNSETEAQIVKTYSFLIGTPSVELLYNEDLNGATPTKADKYWLDEFGNAHCFAKATITGGANFTQTGTEFGFIFDTTKDGIFDKSVDKAYTKGTTRNGNNVTADAQYVADTSMGYNSEIHGNSVYFYRMVIEGVTDINALPDVDVYLND